MNGYLPINKPKGITSFDAVFKIRKAAGTKKVGHTGTLDPLAEGLMLICLGKCTKAVSYITAADKGYIAELKLGLTSDTYDITGELTPTPGYLRENISEETIRKTLLSFIGNSGQLPPMYSAKKVDGKKLYELAREGKEIERKPCDIEIFTIDILDISGDNVKFYVHCSKGTYIRSLIHDFGEKLGCGAVMVSLKRVKNGNFCLDNMKVLSLDNFKNAQDVENFLLPPDYVFRHLKALTLNSFCERIMKNGIPVNLTRANIPNIYENGELIRIYNEENEFLAICRITDNVLLKLEITFFDN